MRYLSQSLRIVLIRLVDLHSEGGACVPGIETNDFEPQIAVSSGFFDQGVFDEANRRRDDRAGYAAAGCIAKRRADVDPAARRTAKGGDQALQDSSTNTSAHGARYRLEERAQDNILEKAADGISANRPAHDLDNEVDNRSGHFYLPFGPPDRMMPEHRGLVS
jgi:hypothetical protein